MQVRANAAVASQVIAAIADEAHPCRDAIPRARAVGTRASRIGGRRSSLCNFLSVPPRGQVQVLNMEIGGIVREDRDNVVRARIRVRRPCFRRGIGDRAADCGVDGRPELRVVIDSRVAIVAQSCCEAGIHGTAISA